jgi:hypothetical protein
MKRPKEEILQEMRIEILSNLDVYSPFLTADRDIVEDLDSYVYHGNYSHGLCGILINALANMYGAKIVIYVAGGDKIVITPREYLLLHTAFLRKVGEQYNGLVLKNEGK